jgi:hypothetical protein
MNVYMVDGVWHVRVSTPEGDTLELRQHYFSETAGINAGYAAMSHVVMAALTQRTQQ